MYVSYCSWCVWMNWIVFKNASISPSSLPKQKLSQPNRSRSEIAPFEKISACCVAKQYGSSITTSTPASSAILVRAHFETSAGSPRWRKCPLITATTTSAPVAALVSLKWCKCPLWNGLYSTTTPVAFIKTHNLSIISLIFFIIVENKST